MTWTGVHCLEDPRAWLTVSLACWRRPLAAVQRQSRVSATLDDHKRWRHARDSRLLRSGLSIITHTSAIPIRVDRIRRSLSGGLVALGSDGAGDRVVGVGSLVAQSLGRLGLQRGFGLIGGTLTGMGSRARVGRKRNQKELRYDRSCQYQPKHHLLGDFAGQLLLSDNMVRFGGIGLQLLSH